MASIVPISKSVGANRIIPTVAIPYPLGDPSLPREEELAVRSQLVEKALLALAADVSGQTVF
jgi:glycine reductase